MSASFVADVGGTNIRLATVTPSGVTSIKKYLCNDFDTIEDAIRAYFNDNSATQFTSGCVAIACPVNNDWVAMTNHTWAFSQVQLRQALSLDALHVINDFTAVAHSLPVLSSDQVVKIGGGSAQEHGNIAVFGPGTGLGVKHLSWTGERWITLDGEGGHVDFAPNDEQDVVIWRHLVTTLGRASAEEVLSGRGLVNIYTALALHAGQTPSTTEPAQVTERALSNSCPLCVSALQQFCRIMGSFAGNLALNLATTGGVYIGGGIVSRFVDFLQTSEFRDRFEGKGQMSGYVSPVPTFLITEPDHGLLGAAAYLKQHLTS